MRALFSFGLLATFVATAAVAADPRCPEAWNINPAATPPLICSCTAEQLRFGDVFGTGVYALRSNICRAARHDGAVPVTGGVVFLEPLTGRFNAEASNQNDVSSQSLRGAEGGFRFSPVTPRLREYAERMRQRLAAPPASIPGPQGQPPVRAAELDAGSREFPAAFLPGAPAHIRVGLDHLLVPMAPPALSATAWPPPPERGAAAAPAASAPQAFAALPVPPTPAAPPRVREGTVRVVNTALLVVNGEETPLFGITGFAAPHAAGLQQFIAAQGGRLRCEAQPNGRFTCRLPNGVDIAMAALVNGAARAEPNAPAEYLAQQEDARRNRRGVWAQ